MLILLATWVAHNWWRLLIGLVAVIVIIEYHYYRKKDPDPIRRDNNKPDAQGPENPEPECKEADSE